MILYVVFWLNKNPNVMYTVYILCNVSNFEGKVEVLFYKHQGGHKYSEKRGRTGRPFLPNDMQASSTNPCKRPNFWYIVCVSTNTLGTKTTCTNKWVVFHLVEVRSLVMCNQKLKPAMENIQEQLTLTAGIWSTIDQFLVQQPILYGLLWNQSVQNGRKWRVFTRKPAKIEQSIIWLLVARSIPQFTNL